MDSQFPLGRCISRVIASRLFSPRAIITTVNATICRIFFKAQRMWDELSVGRKTRPDNPADSLGPRTTIEMLPDDVLLEIFDHHRLAALDYSLFETWEWHRLAHVCQRWRSIIFASPRRLDLRLVYTYRKPVRKTIDCWSALPISIWYPRQVLYHPLPPSDEDNVIAALQYPDRIREINLTLTRSLLAKLTPLIQDSFPMLEYLQLGSREMLEPLVLPPLVLPSSFLGEFTPKLRHLNLDRTAFPTLPRLLLSATDLLSLRLYEIPNAGYFSPEALVTGLDATPNLKFLEIYFLHPTSSPGQDSPRPFPRATRAALPALTEFQFKGDIEYLEDLVSRIDAPSVEHFSATLFDQRMLFELPQLAQFIGRSEALKSSPHQTSIWLWQRGFSITHHSGHPSPGGAFQLQISCYELAQQVTLLTHICKQLSLLLSSVERLDIEADPALPNAWDETDTTQWLELLSPFSQVRKLELIGTLVTSISSALGQSAGKLGREVLPSLRDLHLRDTFISPPIESSIAAIRLSSHTVSVHYGGDEGHEP
ncbi:hypothetical protein BJV74DRAFT_627584 [Russula compacta]|nr:hypothetical protein BJV74DRAFT_627584 [Russula compacta]